MNTSNQFLKNGNNEYSATRLAFLLWSLGVLIAWFIKSMTNLSVDLASIDPSVTYTLALFVSGKVFQSFSPNEKAIEKGQIFVNEKRFDSHESR